MFPLGSATPRDTATFQAAIAKGLEPLGLKAGAVQIEGDFPRLTRLAIDLSGARFHRGLPVSKATGVAESLCSADSVHLHGAPVLVEGLPAVLRVEAQDVQMESADADTGGKVLTLARAGGGTLDLAVRRSDLEAALLAAAQEAAKSKGAEVKSVELTLQNEAPRALAVRAVVVAKAMFFTTTVTVSGCVEVDAQLNARLRDLHCEGDGMVGKMAVSALRPKLQRLEEQTIPLGQAIAGLSLRDVTLTGGEEIRVQGTFGAAA